MEEIKIKKCPFCGHDPELLDISGDLYAIACGRVCCNNPRPQIAMSYTKEGAIKAWNEYVSEIERTDEVDKKDSDERN